MLDETGFGESPRGGGAVCFGSAAITNFLAANNLSYIIRAHEAHAHGVSLSKSARCVCDHPCISPLCLLSHCYASHLIHRFGFNRSYRCVSVRVCV